MALEGAGDTSLLLGKGDVPPIHEDNAAGRSPFRTADLLKLAELVGELRQGAGPAPVGVQRIMP